jgi:putative sterol carrier protein
MADATTEFFNELGSRGHEPQLQGATATFGFDLLQGKAVDRWFVSVKKGHLAVSKRTTRADCTVRTTRAVFERVAEGEQNAMAALMRGEIELEGNWTLLVQFQRLFPGPAKSRRSRSRRIAAARRAS